MPTITLWAFTQTLAAAQPDTSRDAFEFHFQLTTVSQYHPGFSAVYSGPNSMADTAESATSLTTTLSLVAHISDEFLIRFDPEIAGGAGLSKSLGIASFPNGETFRVGDPAPHLYIARLFAQYSKRFSSSKHLTISVGKLSLADFLDNNAYAHDARSQFLNWSLMSNGAWDYAANTRGYTVGLVADFTTDRLSARLASALIPTSANGPDLEWDLRRGHSETVELEYRYSNSDRPGSARLLGFLTHAPMGNYRQAIQESGGSPPSIASTRTVGRIKYGLGLNLEHGFTDWLGSFLRLGWNDGINETWAFTEIDAAASLGVLASGRQWGRRNDQAGFAVAVNGISSGHRDYIAAGGLGFMIGDGKVSYAPEAIAELFYKVHLFENHYWLTPTYQFIANPGYNKDRGPINVLSLRIHIAL